MSKTSRSPLRRIVSAASLAGLLISFELVPGVSFAAPSLEIAAGPPIVIARGVTEYSETYNVTGGQERAQVLDVNLAYPGNHLGMTESHNHIIDPQNEKTTSMAARTGAVAGINGDYFDIHNIGSPRGGLIDNGRILRSPRHHYNAQIGVRKNGSLVVGPQEYRSVVSDGFRSHPVNSINVIEDAAAGKITRLTPGLGMADKLPVPYEPGQVGGTLPPSTLVLTHASGSATVVDSVLPGVTVVPQLVAGREGLLADGAGGDWLARTMHTGDRLHFSGPGNQLTGLISGATMLVRHGRAYRDPTGQPPDGATPHRHGETMVGVSENGEHAILAVIDGNDGTASVGVTPQEATEYMIAHGVDSAVLFDGGGSSTLAARKPGDTGLSIFNKPSDKTGERPVANGIFVYRKP